MSTKAERVDELIRLIRAAFGRLRVAGDELHRDAGVTSAMRAVMEGLAEGGPATVPEIARAKLTSRQNIQVLVDGLVADGLVTLAANPAHRRSPLVALSPAGRKTFAAMRRKEMGALAELSACLADRDLDGAIRTLDSLVRTLDQALIGRMGAENG